MQVKNKLKAESTVFLASLVGILVLANVLSVRFFFRGDLTEDGTFTLSKASISLVQNLKDKVVVKAYFTKNLPGRFASLERHVRDLLEEYADRSNGKMKVEFIDPADDEEEEKVAKSLGIQKMPNPDIEKDQATVKEGYRGISFSYGEQTDVIAAVDSPVGLEYRITSALKKISGQKADLGFVVGHGEPEIEVKQDPNQQMMPPDPRNVGAYRNIRNNLDIYNYKQVDLKKGKAGVPGGTKALIIVGTREKIEDAELYKIDQFLLNGGSVAFFVDGVNVNVEQGQFPGMPPQYKTSVNEPNLREFLKHHGIELDKSLVMDAQASDFPARCPPIPITLPRPYPAWPIITAFGEDHPITHRLGSLTLPYATAVRVTDAARNDAKRKALEIAFSSGNSWVADGDAAVVDPCEIKVSKELESSIPMAAAVTGTFTSFFKGKEIPKEEAKEGGDVLNLPEAASFVEESGAPGRLVVVGSSGLPEDETIGYLARIDRRQAMNNFTFVQNVLDWRPLTIRPSKRRPKRQRRRPSMETSSGSPLRS
jgi:gliding-associated putative ABC transporter substrate-binding component GldG